MTDELYRSINNNINRLKRFDKSSKLFLNKHKNESKAFPGGLFYNKPLAALYRQLANNPTDARTYFYTPYGFGNDIINAVENANNTQLGIKYTATN